MPQTWRIVGGADKGGILVRRDRELTSAQEPLRLSTGALVEELALVGERLHYRRLSGTGPDMGWVSVMLSPKVLAERVDSERGGKEKEKAEAAPLPNGVDPASALSAPSRPRWVEESANKMQAFRDGTKMLPVKKEVPVRLQGEHPRTKLPPFKRLDHKTMAVMSVKNLPGCFSGLKFPHNSEQLRAFGPEWYTEAFHKFGTLPWDNRVKRVVEVKQLPHAGFDAAGGAGHKAFVTLEYERSDPELHTELFAKFPWDYFESETATAYRMQLSTYNDMDAGEILVSLCCEHLFPFQIPKFYFGDINRDTTNYLLLVEKIPFGRRGRIENKRLVEKIPREPYEIWPVCGKYQDYLLEGPAEVYACIFRTMAQLAAWDQQGQYDEFLGPMIKFTPDMFLAATGGRKPLKARRKDALMTASATLIEKAEEFALEVAPQVFTARGKDPEMLRRFKQDIVAMSPYFDDIRTLTGASSDWVAAMHLNLQADNAYFWEDEHGNLDAGVFDWCGFQRSPFVQNFMGCLSGAEADLLDAHEDGLMKIFCDEYERYGGPHIDWQWLRLMYRLLWPSFAMDCCQWIDRDIYRECPKEEWSTVQSRWDDKFVDRWNVRCRTTTLINALDFWPRRNFKTNFDDWKDGIGQAFITPYTL